MQEEYPAQGGVRLRRICGDGQAAAASGRVFECGRCSRQVIVCRCCDRGQAYCNAECFGQVRRQRQREAGQRWQRSRRGRRLHAASMARSRANRVAGSAAGAVGTPPQGRAAKIVTQQGPPAPGAGDLLAGETTAMPRDDASPADLPGWSMPHCHWCGRSCPRPLRREFMRRRDRRR
jgi:hypothetical protein